MLCHKQYFYKEHQAEIEKKVKQRLSNTLRLIFWQKCPKNCVCFNDILWLILKKMKRIIKKDYINMTQIDLDVGIDTNVLI